MTDQAHDPDPGGRAVLALRDRIGPLETLRTGRAISREAGRALREIESLKAAAAVRIAETAITSDTTKICAAIAARAMPSIGALTTALNTSCAAVDASLTTSCAADVVGHITTRTRNRASIESLVSVGQLCAEEASILTGGIENDFADDVERSRIRMKAAKTAVSRLHNHALSGIESTRSALSGRSE
jgi:hypothetical protein